MSSPARQAWLSLTPEPERDLPAAIAALRAGGRPTPAQVEAERERAERLVLRGSRRGWLAWLNEGLELADQHDGTSSGAPDVAAPTARLARPGVPDQVAAARELLLDVIENHHALEQGLPGRVRSPAGDRETELMRSVWGPQSRKDGT